MARRSVNKPEATPSREKSFPWAGLLQALLIAAAAFWVFAPALDGAFIGDDSLYVSENPLLRSTAGLEKIWFQPGKFIEYYPIEESVLWLEWQAWGDSTTGYHVVNVALHILSALLVWVLLARLRLPLAWIGGLIFAIHPAQVESVAWISELKNSLSMPFVLATLIFWIDYEERNERRDYALALGSFLVAMLCKITFAPFPALILLYAWWKRKRMSWSDLRASAPFFVIALALGATTIWAGQRYARSHSIISDFIPVHGWLSHLALAGLSLSFYFAEAILPLNPLPFYPQWQVEPPSPAQFLPWVIAAVVLGFLWHRRDTWGRHALLGLGFFVLFLAPFLGFPAAAYMQFSWVEDHFLYIAIIGLIGLFTAALGHIASQLSVHGRGAGVIVLAVACGFLAVCSHVYAASFANADARWIYLAHHSPGSWWAHVNLGTVCLNANRPSDARAQFEAAAAINPSNPESPNNIGCILASSGRLDEALPWFQQALRNDPTYLPTYNNLAIFYLQSGHPDDAIAEYQAELRLAPDDALTHAALAQVFAQTGRWAEAAREYETTTQLDPDDVQARVNEGIALVRLGNIPEAKEQFQRALRLDPANQQAQADLATLNAGGASGN